MFAYCELVLAVRSLYSVSEEKYCEALLPGGTICPSVVDHTSVSFAHALIYLDVLFSQIATEHLTNLSLSWLI